MGLFSKLRPDDRRKLLPMVREPYKGHSKTNMSESSAADGSEFLLVASGSSFSLADTHKRHSDIPKGFQGQMGPLPASHFDQKPDAASRKLIQMTANPGVYAHNYGGNTLYQGPQGQQGQFRQFNQNYYGQTQGQRPQSYQGYYSGHGRNYQTHSQYQFPAQEAQQIQLQGQPTRESAIYSNPDTSAEFSEESTSESGSGSELEEFESESEFQHPSQKHPYYEQWRQYYAAMASYQAYNQQGPESNYRHSMYPGMPISHAHSASSVDQKSDYFAYCNQANYNSAESNVVQHSRRSTIKLNRSSSVPLLMQPKQSTSARNRAISVNVTIPDEVHIPHSSSMGNMRNVSGPASRRASGIATFYDPRRASRVPSSENVYSQYSAASVPRSRVPSGSMTMPKTRKSLSRQESIARKGPRMGKLLGTNLMTNSFLSIKLDEHGNGEISDYEAFLFDGSDAESTQGDILATEESPVATEPQGVTETQDVSEDQNGSPAQVGSETLNITDAQLALQLLAVLDSRTVPESQTTQNIPQAPLKHHSAAFQQVGPNAVINERASSPGKKNSDSQAGLRDMIVQQGPPSLGYNTETVDGLNRQDSSASTSSYNSLQSEKNFSVGRMPNRLVTPSTSTSSKRRTKTAQQGFVPPMQGPPPPIFSSAPVLPARDGGFTPVKGPEDRRSIGANHGISESFYIQQMQQQIQQLQQMQQMMPMYGNNSSAILRTLPPPQARSSDSTINEKIIEFIELRKIIASGNKTDEYRLKWMKMLVVAVQYKLFAYISIKGDSIPHDQIGENKRFFVKSAVTHLQKLIRELDGPKLPSTYTVLAEACYIYGCLLKQEYAERFEQDFGIARDDEQASSYLSKCLELNPAFFKAHYLLAEIYEQQETEEAFDRALDHYKESARLGYYRGIYRMALILLMVPKVRNLNYIKYFRSLSDIDMKSSDIQLTGTDRDELEEVVGLALYQLGRIYEGIYPGDLTADDEFVRESLELAPVNYAKSLTYYNRAAKHHCLLAQVKLGHIYETGDLNRQKNASKSIQWYIKASTSPLKFKRHPEAMVGISRWFLTGSNGESKHIPSPDTQRAVEWCERAVKEFQSPEACHMLGMLAQQGLGPGNAQEWFAEAARLGYQPRLESNGPIEASNENASANTNAVQ